MCVSIMCICVHYPNCAKVSGRRKRRIGGWLRKYYIKGVGWLKEGGGLGKSISRKDLTRKGSTKFYGGL